MSIQGQVRRYAVICTRNLRKAKLVEPWKGTAASGLGAENRGRGGAVAGGQWSALPEDDASLLGM